MPEIDIAGAGRSGEMTFVFGQRGYCGYCVWRPRLAGSAGDNRVQEVGIVIGGYDL
jgi:hypothetical protein